MTMTLFADPSGTLGKIQVNGVDILELSQSPPRLRGDFSNATVSSRLAFQSRTTNGFTAVTALPNGSATLSALQVFNSSNPDNAALISIAADATVNTISSAVVGAAAVLPLVFSVNGEAMRIDTTRHVLLNTPSAMGGILNIQIGATSGSNDIAIVTRNTVDGNFAALFKNAAGANSGNITVNVSSVTYNTSSDPRLKNTIAPLTGSGAIIDALNPVTWLWNIDGSPGAGFLAPQFQSVFPRAVTGVPDEVDVDLNPIYQMIDASTPEVMAVIVAELQDIRLRLTAGGL